MTTAGLPGSLPGFDDPLALLRACHEKILAHCDMLEALISKTREAGADAESREVARNIVRYFSTSAKLHHRDEEDDLFPRLIRQSLKISDLINALKQEHETLDSLWKQIEPTLGKLPDEPVSPDFATVALEFCRISREHVALENMEFLPLAASSLSQEELGYIGEAMAERRGVRWSAR